MPKSALLVFVTALAFATAVHAMKPPVPPPSPAEIARARAIADRFIQRNKIGGIFTNATTSKRPIIRHKASGLVCDVDATTRVSVHDAEASCSTNEWNFEETRRVVPAEPSMTPDDAANAITLECRKRYSDLRPYKGPVIDWPTLPDIHTLRFTAHDDHGRPVFIRIGYALARGWLVEDRLNGALKEAGWADSVGDFGTVDAVTWVAEPAKTP